jgi:phage baseplate assembly protein W
MMDGSVPGSAGDAWPLVAGTAAPPSEVARFDVAFPLQVAAHGRVAGAHYDDHVAQMIEQVLFTSPGERVNRPDFGCGVLQMVFGPDAEAQAAAAQFLVLASLQRWLGEVILVQSVTVQARGSTLAIVIQYVVRATGQTSTRSFAMAGSGA